MSPETIELIKAIATTLLPLAVEMFRKAMAGEDPMDALAAESVKAIVGEQTKLSLAQKAARARIAAKG